jgi:predicted transcriptional regulator
MNRINVHVGTLRHMGDRLVNAWKRAEVGEVFEERHVTFFTWEELTAALTPKRLELLRHLHRKGAESIAPSPRHSSATIIASMKTSRRWKPLD